VSRYFCIQKRSAGRSHDVHSFLKNEISPSSRVSRRCGRRNIQQIQPACWVVQLRINRDHPETLYRLKPTPQQYPLKGCGRAAGQGVTVSICFRPKEPDAAPLPHPPSPARSNIRRRLSAIFNFDLIGASACERFYLLASFHGFSSFHRGGI